MLAKMITTVIDHWVSCLEIPSQTGMHFFVWCSICVSTVLTRNYAPFDYKPLLTICKNLLWRYILSNLCPRQPYMKNLQ